MQLHDGYLLTEFALLIKAKMSCGSFCPLFGKFSIGNPLVYEVSRGYEQTLMRIRDIITTVLMVK